MMNNWSQLCFAGGYVEVAVAFPGLSDVAGSWPPSGWWVILEGLGTVEALG